MLALKHLGLDLISDFKFQNVTHLILKCFELFYMLVVKFQENCIRSKQI